MTKPGDFFVGIIDLFAIFLPGGLVTFILFQEYSVFLSEVAPVSADQYWIAFLFFSYLMGHIVFMIGSRIDPVYDFHRKILNPYTNESAYQCATRIKHDFLNDIEAKSLNTYQWATSILATSYPEAMAEVNRLVADSKFFRSLVVIIPLIGVVFVTGGHYLHAAIVMLFIVPCYLRYYGRRLKSTTRAYQYIIMLRGLGKLAVAENSSQSQGHNQN